MPTDIIKVGGNYIISIDALESIIDQSVLKGIEKGVQIANEEASKKIFISTKDAGQQLGKGKNTVISYIDKGVTVNGKIIKLKATQDQAGGHRLIRQYDLDRFKEELFGK
jgi:hypothetical protein